MGSFIERMTGIVDRLLQRAGIRKGPPERETVCKVTFSLLHKENPIKLVLMGASPSGAREIVLPAGTEVSIAIGIERPQPEARPTTPGGSM